MKYRTLGRTGLNVSLASLGTGGPSRLGQSTHGEEDKAHRVVYRALDLGINLFDTAAAYSDSEAILGRALKSIDRDRYFLATKFTPEPNEEGDLITPEEMVASCEQSLSRLQTDCIDIFQFHGLLPRNYRQAVERLYPAAVRLKEQGKIRFIGVTEYFFYDVDHKMLEMALEEDIWDTLMVKYGVMNMSAQQRVLPLAKEKNVGVMNMSAVRVKMTRPEELEKTIAVWKQKGLIPAESLPDKGPLDFLVNGHVDSVVKAGYKFGIGHEAISTLLFGTGNVEHLEENVATILGEPLLEEDNQRLLDIFGSIVESEGDTG